MNVVHRAALAALVVGALLASTGCDLVLDGQPTAADWSKMVGRDLNCPGRDEGVPRPGSKTLLYDINGDNVADTFVDLICAGADPTIAPDQLEAFSGTSTNILAPLSQISVAPNKQLFLAQGCVYFTGNKVVVVGMRRNANRPNADWTNRIAETWTYSNALRLTATTQIKSINQIPGCS